MQKITSKLFITTLLLLGAARLTAQDVRLKSGSPAFLKGETVLNVEYVYDGLTVGKDTEQAYIDKKVSEYNAKEAGTGDKWLASWKADRARRYEPKFEELLNKQFDKKVDFKVAKNPDAKFTLVLKTTNLEPGWNAAVMRAPATVSTVAEFYETKDRSKLLAEISIVKAPGRDAMGYDFDVGYRLQESYAKTGKELGSFLYKKALK